jgi:hypothetical protein
MVDPGFRRALTRAPSPWAFLSRPLRGLTRWRFGIVRLWEIQARTALASEAPGVLAPFTGRHNMQALLDLIKKSPLWQEAWQEGERTVRGGAGCK